MPSIAFDASTLINFDADGSTILLQKHFRGRAYIAAQVEDTELGRSSGAIVMVGGSRWIERVEISGAKDLRRAASFQSLLGSAARHRGEAETFVICMDRGSVLATDDDGAALVAQSLGIRVVATTDLLNLFISRNHLSADQAREIAARMQAAGQNVDPSKIRA